MLCFLVYITALYFHIQTLSNKICVIFYIILLLSVIQYFLSHHLEMLDQFDLLPVLADSDGEMFARDFF